MTGRGNQKIVLGDLERKEGFGMTYSAVNTIWVLLGAALVFFMQAGFSMCEAGFTRAKNTRQYLDEKPDGLLHRHPLLLALWVRRHVRFGDRAVRLD